MKIAGLQKVSLIDYPGKIAAVVFTQGCNLRCGYCHNPELVYPESFNPPYVLTDIFDFLNTRRGRLEGVVVTGGEPTLQEDLADFLKEIKAMEYSVKLDTNGTNPSAVSGLIRFKLVDYIAMDIKAPFSKYTQICGASVDTKNIAESITLLENSGVDHHFRTTFDKDNLSRSDIGLIHAMLKYPQKLILQEMVAAPHALPN
jgi:pyruvate formate lyase activating enzyme